MELCLCRYYCLPFLLSAISHKQIYCWQGGGDVDIADFNICLKYCNLRQTDIADRVGRGRSSQVPQPTWVRSGWDLSVQMLLPAQTDIADFNICLEKIVCRQYRINRYIADRAGTGEMLINLIVLLVPSLPADFPDVFYIFVTLILKYFSLLYFTYL